MLALFGENLQTPYNIEVLHVTSSAIKISKEPITKALDEQAGLRLCCLHAINQIFSRKVHIIYKSLQHPPIKGIISLIM